ncbi:hypothetical protein RclHR1_13350003 [Rhizophagus clarus]|uniref:Bromo domain-containing protein n=1 Tax=Rhizophagus clarus TaxID=94130 RepID=A0A2Z6Q9Q6_9GLOM|nr:hypothetical protein RclHR1_13350003 [Rhizophagus clarus]
MSNQQNLNVTNDLTNLEREVMFQVARFLQRFPQTRGAHQSLVQDLTEHPELLPLRTDFEGNIHLQTYEELVRLPCRPLNIGKLSENLYQSEMAKFPEIDVQQAKLGLAQHAPSRLLAGLVDPNPAAAIISRELGGGRIKSTQPIRLIYNDYKHLTTLDGHNTTTYCILFDRGGKRIITGSDDRLAKVWCSSTGVLLRSLQGHRSVISDMAISKDGNLLATASEDATVLVWDLENYQVVKCLRMDDTVTSIAFSPSPLAENRYILATSDNWHTWIAKYERVQGATSFGEISKIKPVNAVGRVRMKCSAFNHTGSLFAVSGTDGLIRIFSTIVLEDSKVTEDEGKVECDEAIIEENGENGKLDEEEEEIDILDVVMPRPFVTHEEKRKGKEEKDKESIPVRRVSVCLEPPRNGALPDPSRYIELSSNINVSPYIEPSSNINISPYIEPSSNINISPYIEPSSNINISPYIEPSSNIIVSPINIHGSPESSVLPIRPSDPPSSLKLSEPPSSLLIDTADVDSPGSDDTDTYSVGSNFSFNSTSPPYTGQIKVSSQNRSPVYSQRHQPVHARIQQEVVEQSQTKSNPVSESMEERSCPANPVIPNPNVGSKDKKDNKKNDVSKLFGHVHIADLDGHIRTVNSLEFAHGDNRLLSGSDDGTARIWRYDYFKQQWISITLSVADDASDSDHRVTAMRWSVDDALVILGDNKGKIRVYNSQNGELKIEIHAHSNDLYVLDIHPHDWRTIMSAGYDGKISMWDIQDGRNVRTWDRTSLNFIDSNLEELRFHDGKFRDDGSMFAVTDNAGKCHLIGIDQTASYEKFHDRALSGQKFRSDYDDYEEYSFDDERGVLINVNSGFPQNPDAPREVVNWGGVPYLKQTTQNKLKAISTGISGIQEWQEDNYKRDALVEEVEEIKYGNLVKLIMDKKDVTKRRRKIVIEEEYEYIDSINLDETSFTLPDDSDDEDYVPGLSDREGTPDSTDDSDYMEIDAIPASVVNSPDLDSDYGVKTRRQKKAEKKAQKDRRLATAVNTKNKKRKKRPRTDLSEEEEDEYIERSNNDYGNAGPSTTRPLRRVKRRINYGESETNTSEDDSYFENDRASLESDSKRARTPKSPSGSEYQEDSEQEESQNNYDSPYIVESSSQHEVSPYDDTHGNHGGDNESYMDIDYDEGLEQNDSEQVNRATLASSMDTSEPEDDTRPEWIRMIKPQASPYHPQIGDVIVYFLNGHKEMLRKCYHDNDNSVLLDILGPDDPVLHKDHAWNKLTTDKKAKDNILFCLIDDIEWIRGDRNKPFVKITAKTLNLQNNKHPLPLDPMFDRKATAKVTIYYYDYTNMSDFIVLYDRVAAGLNKRLKLGEKVFATYDNTSYSGTIVQIDKSKSNDDWSPWPTYTVNWDPENSQDTLHSWELKRENEQDLIDNKTYGEEEKATISKIISALIVEVDFDWFVNHVNFTEVPDYLPKIPYPMCLRMIEARLQNDWYRSLRAIKADIDLIHWNATNYNESGTEIPTAAHKLLSQFKRLTEEENIHKQINEELPSCIKSSIKNLK